MPTHTLRFALAVLGVSLLAAAPELNAGQNKPTPTQRVAPPSDGWWIQVNTGLAAKQIVWELGTTPNNPTDKFSWQLSGDNFAIPLAEPLRSAPSIYIRATAIPANASATFCVFWQRQGVALVQFTGSVERQLDTSMKDPQCRLRFF